MSSIVHTNAAPVPFRTADRIQQAITAPLEKKILVWLAERVPESISPDHLTLLGLAAQLFAGVSYALARWNKWALLLAVVFIGMNWLGDSLDGTLARYRGKLRPRYGFYVDHMVDTFGSVFLMGGLAVSGFIHWQIAIGMLVGFLVLSVESYLTTYTIGKFSMSHGLFGPTEIRILLIVGSLALLRWPHVHRFGHDFLLFDIGGTIAIAGMTMMAIIAAVRHTVILYREERLS